MALLADRLTMAAWANVVTHVLGLSLAVVWMRPGTAAFSLPERMAYLAANPLGWRLGWAAWGLCALAMVAFLGALLARQPAPALYMALGVACAAAAVDLTCDVLFVTVVPRAAAGPAPSFLLLERGTHAVSLMVANGLYSVAVLVASRGLRLGGAAQRHQQVLGLGTFIAGLALAGGGFTGNPRHVELATGPTVGLFMAWTLVVARGARS